MSLGKKTLIINKSVFNLADPTSKGIEVSRIPLVFLD